MKALSPLLLSLTLALVAGCDDGTDINSFDSFSDLDSVDLGLDTDALNRIDTTLTNGVYRLDSSVVSRQCTGPRAAELQTQTGGFEPDFVEVDASSLRFVFDFTPLNRNSLDTESYGLNASLRYELDQTRGGERFTNEIDLITDTGFVIDTNFTDNQGTNCLGKIQANWSLQAQSIGEFRSNIANSPQVAVGEPISVSASSDRFYRLAVGIGDDQLRAQLSDLGGRSIAIQTDIYNSLVVPIASGTLTPADLSLIEDTSFSGATYYLRLKNTSSNTATLTLTTP